MTWHRKPLTPEQMAALERLIADDSFYTIRVLPWKQEKGQPVYASLRAASLVSAKDLLTVSADDSGSLVGLTYSTAPAAANEVWPPEEVTVPVTHSTAAPLIALLPEHNGATFGGDIITGCRLSFCSQ